MNESDLIETWMINNRINLYLLAGIPDEHLSDQPVSKGRTVGEQFAHLHNVRLMWLHVSQPEMNKGLEKLERGIALSAKLLSGHLEKSAESIAALLRSGFKTGKIKNFKPHPSAFLGYMLSHEAHHRGQILISLKQSGHPVDKKLQYGIWEWGVR